MKRYFSLFLIFILAVNLFAGCSGRDTQTPVEDSAPGVPVSTGSPQPAAYASSEEQLPVQEEDTSRSVDTNRLFSMTADDLFTTRDRKGTTGDDAVTVFLADGAPIEAPGISVSNDIITIMQEGNYLFRGTLTNGQIVVDAPNAKVQLVLDGVSITRNGSAAVYVKEADKVFLTLADRSENTLRSTGSFKGEGSVNVDGTVFSRRNLTLNGYGSATITCQEAHGIVCKDNLRVCGGTWNVTAAKGCLNAKKSFRMMDGELHLKAGTNGIKSEDKDKRDKGYAVILGGTIHAETDSSGIKASGAVYMGGGSGIFSCGNDAVHSDSDLLISGGSWTAERCKEGLEGETVTITGGSVSLRASDDGINASSPDNSMYTFGHPDGDRKADLGAAFLISGGSLRIWSGGDGIDSNGSLVISGGSIFISGPTSGRDSALDYGISGHISGGTVAAFCAKGEEEFMAGRDGCQTICFCLPAAQNAGTEVRLLGTGGNELLRFSPEKTFQAVILTTPELHDGDTCTLCCGDFTTEITVSDGTYSNF